LPPGDFGTGGETLRRMVSQLLILKESVSMIKMSDVCILLAVMVSFAISGYLWFTGNKEQGLFTATWVPSILCFGIYFKILSMRGIAHE
jgi:hypothetical protein